MRADANRGKGRRLAGRAGREIWPAGRCGVAGVALLGRVSGVAEDGDGAGALAICFFSVLTVAAVASTEDD